MSPLIKDKERLDLILVITYQCNLNCPYCNIKLDRNKHMDFKTAKRALDLFLEHKANSSTTNYIKFSGAEPLLRISLLKEIVGYVKQQGPTNIKFLLGTNGILLDKESLDWINNNDIELSISYDGSKDLKSFNLKPPYPPDVIVNMVIMPSQAEGCFDNFLYLYNKGFKCFNFLPAAYTFWPAANTEQLGKNLGKISLFIKKEGYSKFYIKNVDINNETPFFNTGIVVDCNGDIYLNNLILWHNFRHLKKKLCLGNINNLNSLTQAIKTGTVNFNNLLRKEIPDKIWNANKKIDSLITEFVDTLQEQPSFAKRVDIKVSYKCNNKCKFCVQGNKRTIFNDRDTGVIKKDLEDAHKSCQEVVFTGGEATIRKDFIDLVKYTKSLGFRIIQIQTNGRMFAYKNFCQEAIEAGANEFCLAVHGPNAKIHDFLTSIPGSFQQTTQGIKNLKNLGQYVATNTVITTYNYQHLPQIGHLLVNLGVDQYQFAFTHILGTAQKNKKWIIPKKSKIMPYVKEGLEIGIRAGIRVMTEAIPYCLMDGYEEHIAEKIIPEAMIIETDYRLDSYSQYRKREGKSKGKDCSRCTYFNICEGPWKEYPQIYGWDEFKAVEQKQIWNNYYARHPLDAAWGARDTDSHIVQFVENYKFIRDAKALDSGCGHGKNSRYLIKKGYRVFGIDIAKAAVEYSRANNPAGNFSVQDASGLNFQDNFFDLIIDAGCYHVNPPSKRDKIIENYYRVLKPKGKLFIRIFNRNIDGSSSSPIFYEEDLPVWGFKKNEILDLFSIKFKSKFTIDKILFEKDYGINGIYYIYLEKI